MTAEAAPPGSWPASPSRRELSLLSCGTRLTDTLHCPFPTPGHGTYFFKHTPHTGTSVTSAMQSLSRKVGGWVCRTGNVKSPWDLRFRGGEVAAVLIFGSTDYDGSVGLLREAFATSPKVCRVLRGPGITQFSRYIN